MKQFLALIFLVLISCNGQKKAAIESDNAQEEGMETNNLVLILQEPDSSFDTAETMIIKDAKRLKSFYSKINMTRKPGIPIPVVDFSKEMIVIQCSGVVSQDGLPVLSILKETDTKIILSSNFQKNTIHQTRTTTRPFCIYKMPLSEKNIEIETNFE